MEAVDGQVGGRRARLLPIGLNILMGHQEAEEMMDAVLEEDLVDHPEIVAYRTLVETTKASLAPPWTPR